MKNTELTFGYITSFSQSLQSESPVLHVLDPDAADDGNDKDGKDNDPDQDGNDNMGRVC